MFTFLCGFSVMLAFSAGTCGQVAQTATQSKSVAADGDSVLDGQIAGRAIRVIISAYKIDIGKPSDPAPQFPKTNCTYSRYPCSQISAIRISVAGKAIDVPRSAFADCADIGRMELTSATDLNVLALVGGDASEAYGVKIYFNSARVTKREVYALEAGALVQTTVYRTPVVLK